MQRKECSCRPEEPRFRALEHIFAKIVKLGKHIPVVRGRRPASKNQKRKPIEMKTNINRHNCLCLLASLGRGVEIRRGKSLGLFTRSSLIGTLMRAGVFITAIPISASAQTQEQITAMQAQIAPRQAQKTADLALQAQLDAISQRDALQAKLEDTTLAASQRDSLQNQPKTGKAGANPSQQVVASAADQSQPRQEPQSATPEALPVTLPPVGEPSPSPTENPAENPIPLRPGRHGARNDDFSFKYATKFGPQMVYELNEKSTI